MFRLTMTSGLSASSYQSVFDTIVTSDPKGQNKVLRKDIAKSKTEILQKIKKDIAKNKKDIAENKPKEKSKKINKQKSPAKFSISFTHPLPHVFFHGPDAN